MAATAAATTITASTNLWEANHDSEGASPALKMSVGPGASLTDEDAMAVPASGRMLDGTLAFPGSTAAAVTATDAAFRSSTEAGPGVGNFPRHFFSSHSTQRCRPSDTGNPQAWHLRRFLRTAGTWL